VVERGVVRDNAGSEEGLPISGKALLDMVADDYSDVHSARQGKQLMRMLLNHHLDGKQLHTRELIKELTKL
jgi:DNA repair protein RecO (recombination protein O)